MSTNAPATAPGTITGGTGNLAPPWKPGQSGNPKGRPSWSGYTRAARALLDAPGGAAPPAWGARERWTGAQILAWQDVQTALGLASWAGSPLKGTGRLTWKRRLALAGISAAALERLLVRAEGRPVQPLDVTVDDPHGAQAAVDGHALALRVLAGIEARLNATTVEPEPIETTATEAPEPAAAPPALPPAPGKG
jgi:hypothetical protein